MVRSVKLAKLTVEFTPVNCVWLSALNISARISNLTPLMTPKFFESERSTLLIGGERTKNRADSAPSLPGCGGAKHDVSSCWYGSPLQPRPGSHVEHDARVGIAVSTGEVGGADVRDIEVHCVRPAARPAIDAGDLPVVRHARRAQPLASFGIW